MLLMNVLRKTRKLSETEQKNCLILANNLRLIFEKEPLPKEVLDQAYILDTSDLNAVKLIFSKHAESLDASKIQDFDLGFLVFSHQACLATVLADHLFFLGGFGLEHKKINELTKFTKCFYRYAK